MRPAEGVTQVHVYVQLPGFEPVALAEGGDDQLERGVVASLIDEGQPLARQLAQPGRRFYTGSPIGAS